MHQFGMAQIVSAVQLELILIFPQDNACPALLDLFLISVYWSVFVQPTLLTFKMEPVLLANIQEHGIQLPTSAKDTLAKTISIGTLIKTNALGVQTRSLYGTETSVFHAQLEHSSSKTDTSVWCVPLVHISMKLYWDAFAQQMLLTFTTILVSNADTQDIGIQPL